MWCCGCPDFGIGSKHVRETTIGSGRGWSLVEQNLKKKFTISKKKIQKRIEIYSIMRISIQRSALLGQPDCILVTQCVETIHTLIRFKLTYFRTPKDFSVLNLYHVEISQPIKSFRVVEKFSWKDSEVVKLLVERNYPT